MSRPDRTRARRGAFASVLVAGLIAAGVIAGAPDASGQEALGDLPISPEWLANTLGRATDIGSVKNNTVPGAIEQTWPFHSRPG